MPQRLSRARYCIRLRWRILEKYTRFECLAGCHPFNAAAPAWQKKGVSRYTLPGKQGALEISLGDLKIERTELSGDGAEDRHVGGQRARSGAFSGCEARRKTWPGRGPKPLPPSNSE